MAAALSEAPAPQSGKWIYAIGGWGAGFGATVEAYDPLKGNAWSPVQDMPTPRSYLAATSTAGLLHALGGTLVGPINGLPTHEIYDPASGWSPAPPMPTARDELAAVTGPDGLVYAIGGNAIGPGGPYNPYNSPDDR